MFKHVWSVICQSSLVDKQNNSISLLGCIENIEIVVDKSKNVGNKIVFPIQFDIINYWTIDDSTKKNSFTMRIEMIKPNGESAFQKEQNIFTEIGWSRVRNIAKFSGLELGINDNGRYVFKISQKENRKDDFVVIASLPVDIKINLR